jgi:hypothetical protein
LHVSSTAWKPYLQRASKGYPEGIASSEPEASPDLQSEASPDLENAKQDASPDLQGEAHDASPDQPSVASDVSPGPWALTPEATRQTLVGLLVDYPVLMRAVRTTDADAVPRLDEMLSRARSLGPVVVSRAYGAWYDVDEATTAFTEGLDPVFVPPAGPGNVPTTSALVADGLALLKSNQLQALALSGDDRLLPLVSAAVAEGIPVALIAHSCQPDGPCLKLATTAEPAANFARAMSRAERYRRPTPAA